MSEAEAHEIKMKFSPDKASQLSQFERRNSIERKLFMMCFLLKTKIFLEGFSAFF